jgi:signal transduction histidine kinase
VTAIKVTAMASVRRAAGWTVVALICVGLFVLLSFLSNLPEPQGATRLDTALLSLDGKATEQVSLPHSWPRNLPPGPARADYQLHFAGPSVTSVPQFLLVPVSRVEARILLNGQELALDSTASSWAAPLVNMASLVRLPADLLRPDDNLLTIRLERTAGFRPGYLSKIYIGDAATILPNHRLRIFIGDQFRMMIVAIHVLLSFGVTALFFMRRRDQIFGWFALLAASSLCANLAELAPFRLLSDTIRPVIVVTLGNLSSLALFRTALAAASLKQPRWFLPLLAAMPPVVFGTLLVQSTYFPLAALFGLISVGWVMVSIVILARDFFQHRNAESAVLATASLLTLWYILFDIATLSGLHDRGFLLFPYAQPLMIGAVSIILLRRLIAAMNRLDKTNDILKQRLGAREAELGVAHAQERALAAEVAREQERQRLMHDLHDGLSGHIVSIIALAEREKINDIEQAAREAIDDLRLVIQSLNIGSEDIPVVLAYFRERATPQLSRLGIRFRWSMDHIPDIKGVGPGHALSLLRILQEATTNAVRHGPARRIAITGDATENGHALITVENDGRRDMTGEGNGLRNMRRRAESLGGRLSLESTQTGMRLTLELPPTLPAPTS